MRRRWTKEEAWAWYRAGAWVMGVNYVPSITFHGAEMWQPDTHDEVMVSVRKELELMRGIGINGVRMGIPFDLWYYERDVLLDRAEALYDEFAAYGIGVMPVLFNDCVGFGKPADITPQFGRGWRTYDIGHHGGAKDNPFTGEKERTGWIYWDEPDWRPVMEEFLLAVIGRFRTSPNVIAWDLWNEPGNSNRFGMSIPYLKRSFELARSLDPVQPLTAGVWRYPDDYGAADGADVDPVQRLALDESDIVTFHQYDNFDRVKRVVGKLNKEGRPMMCTEWLNRVQDNLIADVLPYFHDEGIGSFSWGLVAGKSQHFLPWDELWQKRELPLWRWQHDLFDVFHTPYDRAEIELMRSYAKKRADGHQKDET